MNAIKALAVGTAGVLLLGLVIAAGASASYFQATSYPAEVKAEKEGEANVFGAEGFSVKCEVANFSAELPEPLETWEVAPVYEKCTALGTAATVTMEGCKYRLDANATDVDLVCPGGKKMKIVAIAGNCEVQIGSQNGIEKDEYVNHGEAPQTVTVKLKAEKVSYTKTKDGFLCPLSGLGEKTDGTISGSMLAKAFAGGQVGFFQGKPVPTKLCAEEQPACPEGQTYPASTAIKANATVGELIMRWTTDPNSILECKKWTLSGSIGTTGPAELPAGASFGFQTCEITAGTSAGSKCTVAMSLGGGGLLAVGNSKDGRWKFGGSTLTVSNCTGVPQIGGCEWEETSPALTLRGGVAETATIEADRTFKFKKQTGGGTCPNSNLGATWKVTYVISAEEGAGNVFVTR